VAGLPLLPLAPPAAPAQHENGVYEIDHIVIYSRNWNHTKAAFEAVGWELKREVVVGEQNTTRQSFYRPGNTTVEVLSPSPAPAPASSAAVEVSISTDSDTDCISYIWGITFSCADVDRTHALLSGCTKPPHQARQPGRRMTVLQTQEQGQGQGTHMQSLPLRIAFMSPHVSSPSPSKGNK
jgi:hypothetical protein